MDEKSSQARANPHWVWGEKGGDEHQHEAADDYEGQGCDEAITDGLHIFLLANSPGQRTDPVLYGTDKALVKGVHEGFLVTFTGWGLRISG